MLPQPFRTAALKRTPHSSSMCSPAAQDMHRTKGSSRSGVVLLEALVALVILVTAGAAAVTMAAQSAHDIQRIAEAERNLRAASAFLDVVSLWSRDDLDRHLGSRMQ